MVKLSTGSGPGYTELKYSGEPFKVKDLKVTGHDIMKYGIKGKDIGDILNNLFQLVMDGAITNTRAELLHYLKAALE